MMDYLWYSFVFEGYQFESNSSLRHGSKYNEQLLHFVINVIVCYCVDGYTLHEHPRFYTTLFNGDVECSYDFPKTGAKLN